jgi:hypothetical protein
MATNDFLALESDEGTVYLNKDLIVRVSGP